MADSKRSLDGLLRRGDITDAEYLKRLKKVQSQTPLSNLRFPRFNKPTGGTVRPDIQRLIDKNKPNNTSGPANTSGSNTRETKSHGRVTTHGGGGSEYWTTKDGRQVYSSGGNTYDRKTGQRVTGNNDKTSTYRGGHSVNRDGTSTAHRTSGSSTRSSTRPPTRSSTRPPTRSSTRPSSKPTPRRPTRTPQAGVNSDKPTQAQRSANYKAWAKAHPELAAKLKKGQSGYNETRGSSTSSRPQRGGDGAPGAQSNPTKRSTKNKVSRLAEALQGVKRDGWKKRKSK